MKTLIAFLSASSLAACCASGPNCPPCTSGPNCPPHRVEPGGVPQPDFWAKPEWPHDHELCCTIVDRFAEPDEDMKAGEGDAGPGQTANWLTDKTHNALLMTLLAPEHPLTDGDVARTASMGAFKTGLPFGPDASFSVIAIFQM